MRLLPTVMLVAVSLVHGLAIVDDENVGLQTNIFSAQERMLQAGEKGQAGQKPIAYRWRNNRPGYSAYQTIVVEDVNDSPKDTDSIDDDFDYDEFDNAFMRTPTPDDAYDSDADEVETNMKKTKERKEKIMGKPSTTLSTDRPAKKLELDKIVTEKKPKSKSATKTTAIGGFSIRPQQRPLAKTVTASYVDDEYEQSQVADEGGQKELDIFYTFIWNLRTGRLAFRGFVDVEELHVPRKSHLRAILITSQ